VQQTQAVQKLFSKLMSQIISVDQPPAVLSFVWPWNGILPAGTPRQARAWLAVSASDVSTADIA